MSYQPPKKKFGLLFWIALVIGLLAIGFIVTATVTRSSTDTTATPPPTEAPDLGATAMANSTPITSQPTLSTTAQTLLTQVVTTGSSNASSHLAVGETTTTPDGYMVTVRRTYTSSGADYETPTAGDQYLVVDVSVKNTTGSVQHMASSQFTLIDSTGQQIDDTIATLPNVHWFVGGTLQNGSTMRGQLVYEVPTGKHPYQMVFQADSFSDNQFTWDIHS